MHCTVWLVALLTIVIGTEDRAKEIADTLLSDHHLGDVPCEIVDVRYKQEHVLGRVSDLLGHGHAQHVVVSFDEGKIVGIFEIARILEHEFDVSMSLVSNLRGLSICDLRIDHVFGHDVLFLNSSRRSHSRARMATWRVCWSC
jgi:hypothetical protein